MSTRPRRTSARAEPAESVRILADLRERGIAAELRGSFVERLASVSAEGSPEAYRAALDAVELAYRSGGPAAVGSFDELEQLMSGFAVELRKLEEAMRTLDAYVTRMRSQADLPPDSRLH